MNLSNLAPGERIQAIVPTRDFPSDQFLVFATAQGQVKKTAFSEYDKSRREGFIAINLRDGDELVRVVATTGDDDVFMVTLKGMTIRFSETDVREMGRAAAGVRGMKLRAEDQVVSLDVARDDADLLVVTDAGYGKRTKLERFNRQGRGGLGVRGIRLTAARGTSSPRSWCASTTTSSWPPPGGVDHPHRGARDRLPGPRRDGRARDEPRRRPVGRGSCRGRATRSPSSNQE